MPPPPTLHTPLSINGLKNMSRRLAEIGGRFEIVSADARRNQSNFCPDSAWELSLRHEYQASHQ